MVNPKSYLQELIHYYLTKDEEISNLVEKISSIICSKFMEREIKIEEIDIRRKKPVEVVVFINTTSGYSAFVAIRFKYRGDTIFEITKQHHHQQFMFYEGGIFRNISGDTWRKVFYRLFELFFHDRDLLRNLIKNGLKTALLHISFESTGVNGR